MLFRSLPLLRPALWGAALLVFVDCLKELPMTLLLRPLNVDPDLRLKVLEAMDGLERAVRIRERFAARSADE